MNKLAIFLATLIGATLASGFVAVAQPMGPPPSQELSSKEKAAIGKETTANMQSYLELNAKQVKKLGRLNKRFADVVGQEKTEKRSKPVGRPVFGDESGPNYGRPAKPGRQEPMFDVAGFPEDVISEELAARRKKYVKKLGKVLTAEQFQAWQSRQHPFPGDLN